MASTIDDAKFVLVDNFPGVVTSGNNPSDWTSYSTTEDFPLGTKRLYYDDTHKSWCTLIFLKITGGTEGNANGMAVKSILGRVTTAAAAGTAGWAHTVTPDGGEAMLNGPIAVALGTVSAANFTANTSYYGWCWCDGPPPEDLVSGLGGNYTTDENVLADTGMDLVDNTGPLAFGLLANTDIGLVSALSGSADV